MKQKLYSEFVETVTSTRLCAGDSCLKATWNKSHWVDLPFKGKLSPWSPDTVNPLHSSVVVNPSELKRSGENKTLNHTGEASVWIPSVVFLIKRQKCSILDHLKHNVGNENSQTWMHCCRLVSLPQKRGDNLNNPSAQLELYQASRVLLNTRLTYLCFFFSALGPVFHGKAKQTVLTGSFPLKMFLSLDFCCKASFPDFTSLSKALCLQLPASKLLH